MLLRNYLLQIGLLLGLLGCTVATGQTSKPGANNDEWRSLLDQDLSKWEVFTGVPHTTVDIDWDGKGDDGITGKLLGLGRNERGIFTAITTAGLEGRDGPHVTDHAVYGRSFGLLRILR